MERYGSDKPDLRYGVEIADITNSVRDSGLSRLHRRDRGGRSRARDRRTGWRGAPRVAIVDRLTDLAREAGAKGLVWVQFSGEGPLTGLGPTM